MRPFEGCRLRIERAEAQFVALTKLWGDISPKDLYTVRGYVNWDGTGSINFDRTNPIPPIFALQTGEVLYQLRAALDGAVYQAAVFKTSDPPPNESDLEFPICSKIGTYRKNCSRMLGPLADEQRRIIESVQPYRAVKLPPDEMVLSVPRTMAILHDWARKDRHRRLHFMGAWATTADPEVFCPDNSVRVTSMKLNPSGFLEDKNVLATFRWSGKPPSKESKVEVNPNILINIAINEAPLPCDPSDSLSNRINAMFIAVRGVITKLEETF
jgi:hypothetical protein